MIYFIFIKCSLFYLFFSSTLLVAGHPNENENQNFDERSYLHLIQQECKNKNIAFLGIHFNKNFYKLDFSIYDFVISFQYLENIPNLIYIDLKNENFNCIGFHDKHKYKISKFGLKKLNQLLLHNLNIKNFNLELYILFLLLCNQITVFNVNLNINQNTTLFMKFLIKKNILHIPTIL